MMFLLPFIVIPVVTLPFLVVFAMVKSWLPLLPFLAVAVGSWVISRIAFELIPSLKGAPDLITPFGVVLGLVAFAARRLLLSFDEKAKLPPDASLLLIFVMLLAVMLILSIDLFFAAFGRPLDLVGTFFDVLGGPKIIIAIATLVGLMAFTTPRRWLTTLPPPS